MTATYHVVSCPFLPFEPQVYPRVISVGSVVDKVALVQVFRRVHKIMKRDCWLCHVCLCPSICPHGTTELLLDTLS